MEVIKTSFGTCKYSSLNLPAKTVGYSTKLLTSSNKSSSTTMFQLFSVAKVSICLRISAFLTPASAITFCVSNVSKYLSADGTSTASPKKRCP